MVERKLWLETPKSDAPQSHRAAKWFLQFGLRQGTSSLDILRTGQYRHPYVIAPVPANVVNVLLALRARGVLFAAPPSLLHILPGASRDQPTPRFSCPHSLRILFV